jgi:hypothetical protein
MNSSDKRDEHKSIEKSHRSSEDDQLTILLEVATTSWVTKEEETATSKPPATA